MRSTHRTKLVQSHLVPLLLLLFIALPSIHTPTRASPLIHNAKGGHSVATRRGAATNLWRLLNWQHNNGDIEAKSRLLRDDGNSFVRLYEEDEEAAGISEAERVEDRESEVDEEDLSPLLVRQQGNDTETTPTGDDDGDNGDDGDGADDPTPSPSSPPVASPTPSAGSSGGDGGGDGESNSPSPVAPSPTGTSGGGNGDGGNGGGGGGIGGGGIGGGGIGGGGGGDDNGGGQTTAPTATPGGGGGGGGGNPPPPPPPSGGGDNPSGGNPPPPNPGGGQGDNGDQQPTNSTAGDDDGDDGDGEGGGLGGGAIAGIVVGGIVLLAAIVALVLFSRRRSSARSGDGSYYRFSERPNNQGPDTSPDPRSGGGAPVATEETFTPVREAQTGSGGITEHPAGAMSAGATAIPPMATPASSADPRSAASGTPGGSGTGNLVAIPPDATVVKDRPVEVLPPAAAATPFTRVDSNMSTASDDTIVAPPLGKPATTPSSIAPWFVEKEL